MRRATFKCANCGHEYSWNEAHAQDTVNRGARRYICASCHRIKRYGAGNDVAAHTPKKHKITIGFELECVPYNSTAYASMISAVYGLVPTSDCSLPSGGVEFNTPVYHSMNGLKQMFRSFEKFCDFSSNQCGHHINVGHTEDLGYYKMCHIRGYCHELFDDLGDFMTHNPNLTKKVFGRTFTTYANYPCPYTDHYSFINVENNNRIEFRLAKFVDATQYFWLSCMCVDMTKAIIENFLLDGKDAVAAEKTSKKLVKVFQKYADGKANCQRPERNSK